MVAAVSKIMRVQDLILVAQKIRVVTQFRGTMGLRGRLSTRLQPNHPTDDPAGIAASILDGLLYGNASKSWYWSNVRHDKIYGKIDAWW